MKNKQKAFKDPKVAAVFAAYPNAIKMKLLVVRQLIFDVAAKTAGVGELEETLKWGQPSYLTTSSKSGSTIRIDQVKSAVEQYAIYFHCQTTLVDTFKEIYCHTFKFESNRSILFNRDDNIPVKQLGHCIKLALTYHLDKKQRIRT